METRRHNGFGVDLTGEPASLDKAMKALNESHVMSEVLSALSMVVDETSAYDTVLSDECAERAKVALENWEAMQ